MPPVWKVILENLEERLDEDLLPALYAAVSLPTSEVREELDGRGLTWHDPLAERPPRLEELDLSAEKLITSSKRRAGALGAAGAFAGAIAVPPEVLASLVHSLRLAQRLAVVYGFDPETDRGKLMMWRALAAAYGIDLPPQVTMDLKVKDLPGALASQAPQGKSAAVWVGKRMVKSQTARLTKRVTRLIPGLGTGLAVYRSQASQEKQGRVMQETFKRAWDGGGEDLRGATEAEIVKP
jgi:hypothetical protein